MLALTCTKDASDDHVPSFLGTAPGTGVAASLVAPRYPDQLLVIFCSLVIIMTCMTSFLSLSATAVYPLPSLRPLPTGLWHKLHPTRYFWPPEPLFSSRRSECMGPLHSVKSSRRDRIFSAPALCVDNLSLPVDASKLCPG